MKPSFGTFSKRCQKQRRQKLFPTALRSFDPANKLLTEWNALNNCQPLAEDSIYFNLAIKAAENGADYVAFGAFFPTDTKPGTETAELETIRWWNDTAIVPSVAIGGIKLGNCIPLVEAGTSFLAVIGEIWEHPDGEAAAVSAFNKIFDKAV